MTDYHALTALLLDPFLTVGEAERESGVRYERRRDGTARPRPRHAGPGFRPAPGCQTASRGPSPDRAAGATAAGQETAGRHSNPGRANR